MVRSPFTRRRNASPWPIDVYADLVDLVGVVQSKVLLLLGLASLGLTGFAVFDALRRPTNLFPAVERQTKVFWVAILGVAFLVSFLSLSNALFFLNVIGVIAAGVYLADVRPKIKQISGGHGSGGPYGGY